MTVDEFLVNLVKIIS